MNVIKLPLNDSRDIVSEIVRHLERGDVLVLPTDTVYGLVCDAANEEAVRKIFEIKKRDIAKPLSVFVKDVEMAEKYAFIGQNQREFIGRNWPGVTTVILKSKPGLFELVYKDGTIGLRQPNYALLSKIMEVFPRPLAQTSANISGEGALTEISKILEQFNNLETQPDLIIDAGDLAKNNPSKVIDFTNSNIKIIRE